MNLIFEDYFKMNPYLNSFHFVFFTFNYQPQIHPQIHFYRFYLFVALRVTEKPYPSYPPTQTKNLRSIIMCKAFY